MLRRLHLKSVVPFKVGNGEIHMSKLVSISQKSVMRH